MRALFSSTIHIMSQKSPTNFAQFTVAEDGYLPLIDDADVIKNTQDTLPQTEIENPKLSAWMDEIRCSD